MHRAIHGRGDGAKFRRGKRHLAEGAAGVFLVGLAAFLVGQAVLGCLHKKLTWAYKAHHRENAETDGKRASVIAAIRQRAAKGIGDLQRNIRAAAAAAALRAVLYDAGAKHNGLNHLDHSFRILLRAANRLGN